MDVEVMGVGTMGRNHVRVYLELKEVDKVYIYDIDINRDAARREIEMSEFEGTCLFTRSRCHRNMIGRYSKRF